MTLTNIKIAKLKNKSTNNIANTNEILLKLKNIINLYTILKRYKTYYYTLFKY